MALGVWTAMTAALLVCIAAYTVNVPLAEDWHMVPPLTGHLDDVWSWMWEQNNEHRLPLPRLVLLGALLATRDFRGGMVANVALMAVAAFLILLALRSARGGRLRYPDAFIPIALLHIGNWENFMWAWQLCFVLSSVMTLVLLVALSARNYRVSSTHAATAAVAIAALPLCGANGIAFAAPIAAWLLVEAALQLRARGVQARNARVVLAGLAVAAASTAYYFVDYTRATWNPPSPSLFATIKTAVKFMGLGFGPIVAPVAGYAGVAAALVVAPVVLIVGRRAVTTAEPGERWQACRLLAYLAGAATLALAFGWGRAGLVPTVGLPDRYVLLAVPMLVWAYVAVELQGGRAMRAIVPWTLLIAACGLLPFNTRDGLEWRNWYRDGMSAVVADVNRGMSRAEIVKRHGPFLMHWAPDRLHAALGMLRDAGIGPLTMLRREPAPPSFADGGERLTGTGEEAPIHPERR